MKLSTTLAKGTRHFSIGISLSMMTKKKKKNRTQNTVNLEMLLKCQHDERQDVVMFKKKIRKHLEEFMEKTLTFKNDKANNDVSIVPPSL